VRSKSRRQIYVERVLDAYRQTPGTLGQLRKADRTLAGKLYDHGVPLQTVEDALTLVTARRAFRAPDASPLAPIATLHYVLPVIHELQTQPPIPGYIGYLRSRLDHRANTPVANPDHQLP
jgi:hypothetical protein